MFLLISSYYQNYTGDKEKLGKCEQVLSDAIILNPSSFFKLIFTNITSLFQFFLELMNVPRVESKLRVFAFKITFSSQVFLMWFHCSLCDCACNYYWCLLLFDHVQVDDLRNNLNTINNAAREVWLKLIVIKLVFMGVPFSIYKEKPKSQMSHLFAGERIGKIASDNADNSYPGECSESRHCTRYHSSLLFLFHLYAIF